MSRKHYKICRSCENYKKVPSPKRASFYIFGYEGGYWNNGEEMCCLKLTPQSINGCERCDRYKSNINNKKKKK